MVSKQKGEFAVRVKRGVTLIDLIVAVSIMSIALLVFLSAALTARGVIDKSQYLSLAAQSASSQAATSLGNANSLTPGTTTTAVSGLPQGQVSTVISSYGGSATIKRADISVSWGAASGRTPYSAGAFNFSTLISTQNHAASLFNTGVDNSGALQAQGSVDPHFTITSGPLTGATYVSAPPDPIWIGATANSQWISPAANRNVAVGTYVYRTTFSLIGPPANFSLSINASADDYFSDVRINGTSVQTNFGTYSSWSNFTISSGFVTGINTIDFYVVNSVGACGLQIQMTPSS